MTGRELLHQRNIEFSEFGGRLADILAFCIGDFNHLNNGFFEQVDWKNNTHININVTDNSLFGAANIDYSASVSLVTLCCDQAIHIDVVSTDNCSAERGAIQTVYSFHQRKRGGNNLTECPIIEDVVANIRKKFEDFNPSGCIYSEHDGVTYKTVPGFRGLVAGSDGTIWSRTGIDHKNQPPSRILHKYLPDYMLLKGEQRKEWQYRRRYTVVSSGGRKMRPRGSQLVLWAFVGKGSYGTMACHKDDNCLNDSIGNLYWGTSITNGADCVRNGHSLCGENNPSSKLNEILVDRVINMIVTGSKFLEITRATGVKNSTIIAIITGRLWSYYTKLPRNSGNLRRLRDSSDTLGSRWRS